MKKATKKKGKPISKSAPKKAKKPAKPAVKAASVKTAPKVDKPKLTKGKSKPKTSAKDLVVDKVTTKVQKGKKGSAEATVVAAAPEPEAEVILTNADGKQYCRVHDCDNESTTEGYCRYHYLALWKRNKVKAKILQGGKLDKYIEDLTAKYPDKYLEMLRKDLSSEKDFNLIVAEMDVEDSGDDADNEEETSRFIEEVRGGIPTPDDDEGGF